MKRIEIKNWKEVVDQFGLDDTYMGVKSARQISVQMRKELEGAKELPKVYTTRCNTDSEAIATFSLVSDKPGIVAIYEYTGTAN